jgi:hypothetical protein
MHSDNGAEFVSAAADLGDSPQRFALWKFDTAIWLVLQAVG